MGPDTTTVTAVEVVNATIVRNDVTFATNAVNAGAGAEPNKVFSGPGR